MTSKQHRFQTLLFKYLNGKCSLKEVQELFAYIEAHPDDELLREAIEADIEFEKLLQEKIPIEITNSLKVSLEKRMAKRFLIEGEQKQKSFTLSYLRYAAVIVMFMICSGALYFLLQHNENIEVKTSYGEVKEVQLPDKSTVILNGNSSLTYTKGWDKGKTREVYLKGEAFFEVKHQANDQKFWVHTSNNVKIEVLGTEFNVNDRRSRTQVVLHSGKIRLDVQNANEDQKEIFMNSGDYVEVKQKETSIIQKNVDSNNYISWKDKKLIFKDTPLHEILYLLEDDYGIKTHIKDSTLLNQTFTAAYPADNIDVLLTALTLSFKITIEDTGVGNQRRLILGD